MAHKLVWGLDIGNSAIKAVQMSRSSSGEALIEDFDIIDIQVADDGPERGQKVMSALGTLCSNHDFGQDPVFVSLPGDVSLMREFTLPMGSENKLDELVQFEAKQQIPFPLDQVYMGWERYEDPTGAGIGIELFVVKKDVVQEILKMTDEFHLNVQGITVSNLAIYNFIHHEYQPQGAALVLDAGYKGTNFIVMNNRHVYSRTIPIGGREITRALQSKLKFDFEKAEDLKKNLGDQKQMDRLLRVIEPTMRQLSGEIQRTIGFYRNKSKGQRVQQSYLLGHTFRLPTFADTLANAVRDAPFSIVEDTQRIGVRGVNRDVFANEFPTMAVAIGLGLQGLGLGELDVNFIPSERRIKDTVHAKRPWAIAAVVLAAVTVGVSYFKASADLDHYTQKAQVLEDDLLRFKKHENTIKKEEQPLPIHMNRLERMVRVPRDRGRVVEIFNKISTLRDESGRPFFGPDNNVYLTNLYISRVPFRVNSFRFKNELNSRFETNESDREQSLQSYPGFNDPKESFYAKVFEGLTPEIQLKKPDELKPDVPLLVVLSGECEDEGVLGGLKNLLKNVEGVDDPRLDLRKSNMPARLEKQMWLDKNGILNKKKATTDQIYQRPYTYFHAVFRWNPKDDPDLDNKTITEPKPKPKEKSKKRSRNNRARKK